MVAASNFLVGTDTLYDFLVLSYLIERENSSRMTYSTIRAYLFLMMVMIMTVPVIVVMIVVVIVIVTVAAGF